MEVGGLRWKKNRARKTFGVDLAILKESEKVALDAQKDLIFEGVVEVDQGMAMVWEKATQSEWQGEINSSEEWNRLKFNWDEDTRMPPLVPFIPQTTKSRSLRSSNCSSLKLSDLINERNIPHFNI
jgi:hypothetical protein